MGPLRELLGIDHRQALEFFVQRLRDVSGPDVDLQELLYNASVLAHYAQVSTHAEFEFPAPSGLMTVFDHFVCQAALVRDSGASETAAVQCLLMAGFFEDQMRRRHQIRWYAELGATFFHRAARLAPDRQKAILFDALARRFEVWRQRHASLARDLRDQPFLLPPPAAPPTFGDS